MVQRAPPAATSRPAARSSRDQARRQEGQAPAFERQAAQHGGQVGGEHHFAARCLQRRAVQRTQHAAQARFGAVGEHRQRSLGAAARCGIEVEARPTLRVRRAHGQQLVAPHLARDEAGGVQARRRPLVTMAKQELHAAMLQLRLAVRRHVADELDRADRGAGLQAAQPGRQEVQRQRMRGGETQRGRAAVGDGARLVGQRAPRAAAVAARCRAATRPPRSA